MPRVELWSGRIPVVGWLAHHHWFVVDCEGKRDRWEVWQTRENSPESWGYLHKNLMQPDAWIKRQPRRMVVEWVGPDASILIHRIRHSPQTYPWCNRYHYWPGPNSNTWVQWILEGRYRLGAKGVGSQYVRRALGD